MIYKYTYHIHKCIYIHYAYITDSYNMQHMSTYKNIWISLGASQDFCCGPKVHWCKNTLDSQVLAFGVSLLQNGPGTAMRKHMLIPVD